MHVITLTRPVPRAPTAEAQSYVDEHTSTPMIPRTTPATDNPLEGLNDEEDIGQSFVEFCLLEVGKFVSFMTLLFILPINQYEI